MASDPLLIDISPSTPPAVAMAAVQRWIKQACVNAGISVPSS